MRGVPTVPVIQSERPRSHGIKFWLITAGIVSLLAVLLAYAWWPKGPREPEYRGRTLTQWLVYWDNNANDQSICDECENAIRQIGTNGLPVLLKMLEAQDAPWRVQISDWTYRAGFELGFENMRVNSATFRKGMAYQGFRVLGERAKTAVPDLVAMLSRCRSADDLQLIVSTLELIGPAAEPAVPVLIKISQTGHRAERIIVSIGLGEIAARPDVSVPFLASQLSDPDEIIRREAVSALGKFSTVAARVTPAIVKILEDPDHYVRKAATNALRQIDPSAAAAVGIQ